MADVKISQLPTASAVTSDDLLVMVDSGSLTTQQISVTQLLQLATGSGGSPAGSTGNIQINSGSAFEFDNDLFWDFANNRLGIGTNTPAHIVDISPGTLGTGEYALNIAATVPDASSGVVFNFTSTGTAVNGVAAMQMVLGPGYTGAGPTRAILHSNTAAGTGNVLFKDFNANFGARSSATANTAGTNAGVFGYASNGNINVGVGGRSWLSKASASNVAVAGQARNDGAGGIQIAGHFSFADAAFNEPTFTTTAVLIADNQDHADPIFIAQDNGSAVFTIADGGALTQTAGGGTWEGAHVFNEAGGSVDFRVEGSGAGTNSHLFFVDASTNRVGIGTNAPGATFTVFGGNANTLLESSDGVGNTRLIPLVIQRSTTTTAADGIATGIAFQVEASDGNQYSTAEMTVRYDDATAGTLDAAIEFTAQLNNVTPVQRLTLGPTEAVFNESGAGIGFRVEGSGAGANSHLLFVDASANTVGIGTGAPNEKLTVDGVTSLLTQSLAPSNSTGYGKVYASGSALYFKNDAGTEYNLTLTGSGGGGLSNPLGESLTWDTDSIYDIGVPGTRSANIYTDKVWVQDGTINDPGIRFDDSGASQNGVYFDRGTGEIRFSTQSNNRLRISSGQVLVGGSLLPTAPGIILGNSANYWGEFWATRWTARSAGSAVAPMINFWIDTNTGIYSPTVADDIAISTGGVQRQMWTNAETVINDGGGSYNFRVEGDTSERLLFVNGNSDRVGINTAASGPDALFHISGDQNAVAAALISTDRIVLSEQNTAPGFSIVSASATSFHRGVFKAVRSGGTLSSPAVPSTNDYIFSLLGSIYDGSTTEGTAAIDFYVDGAVSSGVAPARISFVTSATDAASRVERMVIKSDGKVGIGTTNPSSLGVLTTAGAILPSIDNTYSLGDNTLRWKDGYFGPGSVHIGTGINDEATLSFDTLANNLEISVENEVRFENGVIAISEGFAPGNTTGYGKIYVDTADGELKFVDNSGTLVDISGAAASAVTGSGVDGYISYWNGTNALQADTTNIFYWDDLNGRLGIGTDRPDGVIQLDIAQVFPDPALIGSADHFIMSNNDFTAMKMITSSGTVSTSPFIASARSRGTLEVPTSVANGDLIFCLEGHGYDGTVRQETASIYFEVDGTVGSNQVPQSIVFQTGATTTASRAERMRIDSSGNVGIGTATPSPYKLTVEKSSNIAVMGLRYTGNSSTSSGPFMDFVQDDNAALESGHRIGGFAWASTVAPGVERTGAFLTAYANGLWADAGNYGTDLVFETTNLNATVVTEKLRIGTEVVVNEQGLDVDFRVEGSGAGTNSHLFFVDASTNRVGIGHNAPGAIIDARDTQTGDGAHGMLFRNLAADTNFNTWGASFLQFGHTPSSGVTNTGKYVGLLEYLATASNEPYPATWIQGYVVDDNADGTSTNTIGGLIISTKDTGSTTPVDRIRITGTETIFNEPGGDHDFRVEGSGAGTNSHLFFVDASTNRVGIGTNAPSASYKVEIAGNLLISKSDVNEQRVVYVLNTNAGNGSSSGISAGSDTGTQITSAAYSSTYALGNHFGITLAGGTRLISLNSANMFVANNNGPLHLGTLDSNAGPAMSIDTGHNVVFNDGGHNFDFRVEGSGAGTNSHLFFVDASANTVGIGETAPNSTLDVNGSISVAVTTITSSTSIAASHHVVLVDASSADVTITLPAVSSTAGRKYHVKKIDSSSNNVVVDGQSNETIDGETTQTISLQYESITIVNDGSEWFII